MAAFELLVEKNCEWRLHEFPFLRERKETLLNLLRKIILLVIFAALVLSEDFFEPFAA